MENTLTPKEDTSHASHQNISQSTNHKWTKEEPRSVHTFLYWLLMSDGVPGCLGFSFKAAGLPGEASHTAGFSGPIRRLSPWPPPPCS